MERDQEQRAQKPAAPPVITRIRGLLPERFGLLLGGVVGVGLTALFALAVYFRYSDSQLQQREWGSDIARSFANLVADAPELAPRADPWCAALAAGGALRSVAIQDAAGKPVYEWPTSGTARRSSGSPSGVRSPIEFVVDLRGTDGAARGRATLLLLLPESQSGNWMFAAASVAIGALTLGACALAYACVRGRLRPAAAVERGLEAYAAGIEQNLSALALSDGLGQSAAAWNKLLHELSQLRAQGPRRAAGDVGEAAMQKLENRTLRSVLDRLPIGVLQYGPDGAVHYANGAAARLLDKLPESLRGVRLADATGAEVAASLTGGLSATGGSIDQARGSGDDETVLRYQLAPRGGDAELERLLTIQDVTHLREADRARDKFLYHVTHELRTPLTNIQAYAETLTKPDFDDEQTRHECYNVIISETRRLSRLIEDILSISQLEVGTARIDLSPVDLVRLLRQIVQDHLGHADEKRIDLRLALPPKAPKVNGDKERLAVLMNNLIGNAVKYTPEGGQVVVELKSSEQRVSVSVTDNGIGISEADQAHVFDKFYRAANEAVLAQPGTGLGLAIAREVARAHGGDIRVQSEPGKGTTFELELPHPAAVAERGGIA